MRQTTREKLDLNMPLTSRNIQVEMVVRGGIEPPTFCFSGLGEVRSETFMLVKLGWAGPILRVQSIQTN
jgi:hypothetical protein